MLRPPAMLEVRPSFRYNPPRHVRPRGQSTDSLTMTDLDSTQLDRRPSYYSVMARPSVMKFLQFFIWGAWYVTTGSFMTEAGMTAKIGLAYTLCPTAAVVSPFFLGMIADR